MFNDRFINKTINLTSPASGKVLRMPFNAITSLAMKAITVGGIVHRFSVNLCNHSPNK